MPRAAYPTPKPTPSPTNTAPMASAQADPALRPGPPGPAHPAGRDVIDRLGQTAREQMLRALAHWTPGERQDLAVHLTRMVDDFIAYTAELDQPRNC